MDLTLIKQQTTWSEAAESINSNNLKIVTEVTKLQGATYKNKGYFKTLLDLLSAFPTAAAGSKAYVGLSYPYAIYLWENNSWVDSGATGGEEAVKLDQFYTKDETDLQISALGKETDTKLAELSAEIVSVNSEVGNLYSVKSIVLGETYTNTIYGTFKKGQIVRITIKTDVEIGSGNLRLFDDKGQIMTISSSTQDLDITLPNDTTFLQVYLYDAFITGNGDLSFSILTNIALDVSELIPIKEELGGEKNYTSGGYLARPSSVIAADGYAYTDYIPVEPSASITAYHGDVDKTLALLEYGEDMQYLDYWSQSIGTTSRTITTSANTRYVRFSFMEKNAPSVYLECNGKKVWSAYSMGVLDKVNALWDKNSYPTEYEGCEVSVFTKCMCIGDSLTAGVFNKQDGYETIAKYSYPSIFSKITGVETINKGVGGITSEQWYAQFSSESWSGYDMAIIQLGVNDAIQNGGWTSASKTAITNIINKLKSDNQGIKIFVATIIPATSYMGDKYDSVSEGIRALVAELADNNVILLDIAQYGHSADNVAFNVGHLAAYGYWRLAKDYKSYISWIMANNMSLFRDIQFIGTSFVLA